MKSLLKYALLSCIVSVFAFGDLTQAQGFRRASPPTDAVGRFQRIETPQGQFQVLVHDRRPAGERMVLTIKGLQYPFRWCPAGTFMMGRPESEETRKDDEKQHQVTLTRGFWMLETQVTQAMWIGVMGNNPSETYIGLRRPVNAVSWDDCQDFIRALNRLLASPKGFHFSLPTEAQWEYACRAGTATEFNFGTILDKDGKANFDRTRDGTSEVGSYPANAWGLYDMHGNVREWCLDWMGDYPSSHVTDPVGPPSGYRRVLRGFAWLDFAKFAGSGARYGYGPSGRYFPHGLRLAFVPE